MVKRLLFHNESYQSLALNAGLLFFRVAVGLTMAFAHGLGKIPPKAGFVGFVAKIGFPAPELFAWGAGLAELVGGLFLAIGLATRFSALSLAITMAVAGLLAHAADPWKAKELAIVYLFGYIFLFISGAGKFSVDAMISKK